MGHWEGIFTREGGEAMVHGKEDLELSPGAPGNASCSQRDGKDLIPH